MHKKLIYDLPTRIFHWSFALLFILGFFIAKTVDDENPAFSYHMLAGLMLGALLILRLIWGLVGSKYARFSSFALRPSELINYLKGFLTGDKKKWAGHNPASSWAALIMFASAIMLAATGILMSTGAKESYEDLHELFANTFLVTILFHIAGVFLHSIRHQDGIAFSMLHGKKDDELGMVPISGKKPVVAFLLIIIMGSFGSYLYNSYVPATGELNLFGKTLSLTENEKEDEKDDDGDDHETKEEKDDDD